MPDVASPISLTRLPDDSAPISITCLPDDSSIPLTCLPDAPSSISLTCLPAEEKLDTESACMNYLFRMKWPQGFVCPICRHRHAYSISTRRLPLYECARCRHQTSLTTGTVMEGSHTPLTKWFAAIRLMSNPEQGISALRLQSLLAVTYKTAWSILHKIRSAMSEATAETPLTGEVVIHDAAYGRPPMYQPFVAHPGETTLLVGASLSEEGTPGQISMQAVPEKYLSQRRIHPEAVINFRREHMEKDATVAECLINRHFHRSDKISMPLVNQARRWFHHTFHGIGKKHLQTYLHEFCCRMNLMLADKPIFESVSRICATTSPHG